MIKSAAYALGATFVVGWCLFELVRALLAGVIDVPAVRGHDHGPPASLAGNPLAFWITLAVWLVIGAIAAYVLQLSVRKVIALRRSAR